MTWGVSVRLERLLCCVTNPVLGMKHSGRGDHEMEPRDVLSPSRNRLPWGAEEGRLHREKRRVVKGRASWTGSGRKAKEAPARRGVSGKCLFLQEIKDQSRAREGPGNLSTSCPPHSF